MEVLKRDRWVNCPECGLPRCVRTERRYPKVPSFRGLVDVELRCLNVCCRLRRRFREEEPGEAAG